MPPCLVLHSAGRDTQAGLNIEGMARGQRYIIELMTESEDYGTATWRYWQKIRNAADARASFQDRPPMGVRDRIERERDGVEGVGGVATRQGFDGAIFVEFKDRRCSTLSALLHAGRVAPRWARGCTQTTCGGRDSAFAVQRSNSALCVASRWSICGS